MSKKVLVLAGSARKRGNSSLMADEFTRGAKEAGHDTEKVYLSDKNIKGCLGCGACQRNGGQCVQKDDMAELYEKVKAADMIVFAFPVYFYTWNGQMKTALDRLYAVEPLLTGKTFYMLASGQAPTEEYMSTMIDSFRKYIGCFRAGGNQEGGYVFGYGTDKPGDVVGTPAMEQAYELGRGIADDNFTFYEKPDLDECAPTVPEGDFVAKPDAGMYYVSVDPSGRLGWKSDTLTYVDTTAHVLEVLTKKTGNAYKAFLRKLGISYIIAGKDTLDYALAMEKLKSLFHIETLMLGGGGVLNW